MNNIAEKVYDFKTKYKEGFTDSEIKTLLNSFPNINIEKFNDALEGNTCLVINKEIVRYHTDIEKALYCGLENRNLYSWEWD